MTDIAVDFGAADVLGLAGSFIPQGTPSLSIDQNHAEMLKANGDFEKFSVPFGLVTNGTATYKFDTDTGLGTALQSLCGAISNAYMITEITISTEQEDWPTIDFTFHQHANNPHTAGNVFDIPSDMRTILTGARAAYDFAGKVSATVAVKNSTYTIKLNHVDDNDHAGDHWVGTSAKGEEEFSCTFIGNAATPTTVSGWTVLSAATTDSNEAHDESSINARRLVLRN